MPEPSSPSAASLTWRLSGAVPATIPADVLQRQRLAALAAIGFLLGYYAMHNQWIQLGWIFAWTGIWLWQGGLQEWTECLRRDRWMRFMSVLLLVLLVRSSVLESPGITMKSLWLGWLGSGFLMASLMTLWAVARQPRSVVWLGVPLVGAACLAALGSMMVFYVVGEGAVFGRRLQNWFIYGGWNQVCTGLTFGFAAVWASWAWVRQSSQREKWPWFLAALILTLAALLTLSRGAVVALVAGHVAWVAVQGWRRTWRPAALLLGCMTLFQCSAPFITDQGIQDVSRHLGVEPSRITSEMLADGIVTADPAARLLERGDNGRIEIYQAALQCMTTPRDWLIGKGLWADNDAWACSLPWNPEHLHSIFVTVFVRGGLIGLLGLLLLLGWALLKAFRLARAGEELWFILAMFGLFGVLFDGDDPFTLISVSRYEVLLVWVPLVAASARELAANGFAKSDARL